MTSRALSTMLGIGLLFFCLSGCQKSTEPEGGPLNAGPYPECRSIVAWIRAKHQDPEANVTRWGPRTQESDGGPVLIEVHYQATIGKVEDGHWAQTLRVIDRNNIMEETQPVAE
ncbi:MAG TPA: hypothetical protein VE999_23305 [Gemmataceae bacterium]|nr:hypothetical protein [Gemmataceae bacterium]